MPGSKPLKNAKRERFAREYLVDRNGTKAAQRAKYSMKSAHVTASRLLSDDKVRARVDFLIGEQFTRVGLTADRVYDEIAAIAFGNARNFGRITEHGNVELYPWDDEIPDHAIACVQSISQTRTQHGGSVRLQFHDKLGALALAAKLKKLEAEGETPEDRADAIRKAMAELEEMTTTEPEG